MSRRSDRYEESYGHVKPWDPIEYGKKHFGVINHKEEQELGPRSSLGQSKVSVVPKSVKELLIMQKIRNVLIEEGIKYIIDEEKKLDDLAKIAEYKLKVMENEAGRHNIDMGRDELKNILESLNTRKNIAVNKTKLKNKSKIQIIEEKVREIVKEEAGDIFTEVQKNKLINTCIRVFTIEFDINRASGGYKLVKRVAKRPIKSAVKRPVAKRPLKKPTAVRAKRPAAKPTTVRAKRA